MLNLDVNIITFKKSLTYGHQCNKHNTECFIPVYFFQNTTKKVIGQSPQIIFLQINKCYYLCTQSILNPLLINLNPQHEIIFQSTKITPYIITEILNQSNNINFSFNIKIYTSYYFIKHQSSKIIQQNVIGNYFCNAEANTLHIFLTPCLSNNNFGLNMLNFSNNYFNLMNTLCAVQHLPEGERIKIQKQPNEKELNQEHCVCEHSLTNRFFSHSSKQISCLGKFFI
jgi:hypothetical protein